MISCRDGLDPLIAEQFENRCVPSAQYCIKKIQVSCQTLYGPEFPYQCPNGLCKRTKDQCESERVCPPGYTQCADFRCVISTNFNDSCPALNDCKRPNGIQLFKCADQTCANDQESCPSSFTCPVVGQVLCPDNTCKTSAFLCKEPNTCNNPSAPYLCGDNSCASS